MGSNILQYLTAPGKVSVSKSVRKRLIEDMKFFLM